MSVCPDRTGPNLSWDGPMDASPVSVQSRPKLGRTDECRSGPDLSWDGQMGVGPFLGPKDRTDVDPWLYGL